MFSSSFHLSTRLKLSTSGAIRFGTLNDYLERNFFHGRLHTRSGCQQGVSGTIFFTVLYGHIINSTVTKYDMIVRSYYFILMLKMNTGKTNIMFSCSMKDKVEEKGKWPCGECKKGVGKN